MGRAPCCDKMGVKRGPWSPEEDVKLVSYILKHGHGNWRALPQLAGLLRCGKSCRLRWTNYLRPDIKRGNFSPEEEQQIIELHAILGNRWSTIASHLPGRTDNEVKNLWNTHLKKRLLHTGVDSYTSALPANAVDVQQRSSNSSPSNMAFSRCITQLENARAEADARHSMDIIAPSGLANAKTEVNYENAQELEGENILCIESREMDDLLEQALEFPSIEIKPDQNMMFDGSIRKACSISYSPNSACISSTAPNESSISTVETDEMSHLHALNLLPDCHDPHSKLLDNNYNPVEGESFGVDEMFLLGGEDREKAFQRYDSTSHAKLQYNDSALEDTTAATASAFCSQMPFWPSQNAGTLDDRLPSAWNASRTRQRVGQIMGGDGSTSTAHLCPNTSSNFCAADVLLEFPDDSSKDDTVDFDEVCEDNFWIGVLKRVGPMHSPSSYAIN